MSDVEKLMWLVAIIACPLVVLVMPDVEVDEIQGGERGDDGYGSTGK